MMPLPTWMRRALFATAAMNILAAVAFLPAASPLRAAAGFPEGGHPLYLLICSMFVLLFGLGYLWTAIAGQSEPLFITLAAVGKASFVALLVGLWAVGDLPIQAPLTGSGDLVFAGLFSIWLFTATAAAPKGPRPRR